MFSSDYSEEKKDPVRKLWIFLLLISIAFVISPRPASAEVSIEYLNQPLNTPIGDVAISGNFAYVTQNFSVSAFDIISPENAQLIGTYSPTLNQCLYDSVAAEGPISYFHQQYHTCSTDNGIAIFSSVEGNIEKIGEVVLDIRRGPLTRMEKYDHYLFITHESDGLLVIDIANSTNPTVAARFPAEEYTVFHDLTIHQNKAYIATNYAAGGPGGMLVIDVSNPTNPALITKYTYSEPTGSSSIDVAGNYAYVGRARDIVILNISNLENIHEIGRINLETYEGHTDDVVIRNNLLFVAEGEAGVFIIDVTDRANPTISARWDINGNWARKIALKDNYIYLADPYLGFFVLKANGIPNATPTPFLDLPWDYEGKGMSFSSAALSINSYFDHEYPFLSTSLSEPPGILSFDGERVTGRFYSSHDGYDYGKSKAKLNLNEPVLAAAAGTATFIGNCKACGNAIFIDHANGFQTRYYHLSPNDLVVSQTGQPIQVSQGQMIGRMGFTGSVSPPGEKGSHIHFMVIQDKNKDGNFDDNIPDGLVDPFGWQSNTPDPWPNYSFFYNGQQRTGSKSYYLWTEAIANLSDEFDSNGAFFNLEHNNVIFPPGFTDDTYKVNIKAAAGLETPHEKVGYPISLEIFDNVGNLVTQFTKPFTLNIDFSTFDLSRYLPDSLSIFSSSDGINWVKENTLINWADKTASANINHTSYFMLAGERKDTIAPTTTIEITGQAGNSPNQFTGTVEAKLNAIDNDGGLGVDYTAYKINDEDWKEYTNPPTFTEVGNYTIEFYSADKDENIEEAQSTTFSIQYADTAPPEAQISFNPSTKKVEITGIDESETTVQAQKTGFLKRRYIITDQSGNQLAIDTSHVELLTDTALSVKNTKYNNQTTQTANDNLFNTVYALDLKTKNLASLNQTWAEKNLFVNIFYYAKENKSYIYIKENGQVTSNTSQNGLLTLYVETDNGNLKYWYE